MKIKVADLEPNPFRKMESYPIDRAKVESLKSKIQKTFFWDNLVARKHNGKYQLAYGHHRWLALKELKIKEIDIPIKPLSDTNMLLLMADENDREQPSPAIINQTILTVKEYLDTELAKYKNWNHAATCVRVLFSTNSQFQEVKNRPEGVGRDTILKFLGPEWKANKIEIALATLNNPETVDRKAVEELPTMRRAREFVKAVRKHKIPKPTQKKIAKEIVKKDIGSDQIPDLVAEHSILPVKKKTKKVLSAKLNIPSVGQYIANCEADADDLNRRLIELIPEVPELCKITGALGKLVSALDQLTKTTTKITTEYNKNLKRKDAILCLSKAK